MEDIIKKQKNISFSWAGASHKNGTAKRAIKTVVNTGRTMLMHAAIRCTGDKLSTDIWPMAMYYAV